mmetsp:Transcript_119886/g.334472  ORF Transcript_119886/g.334472 Transcript_119886/m.334472 type:complete len:405 (-) Transcript_119886:122-1336(-)
MPVVNGNQMSMLRILLSLTILAAAFLEGAVADRRQAGRSSVAVHQQAAQLLRGPTSQGTPSNHPAATKSDAVLLSKQGSSSDTTAQEAEDGAVSAEAVVAEAEKIAAREEAALEGQAVTREGEDTGDSDGEEANSGSAPHKSRTARKVAHPKAAKRTGAKLSGAKHRRPLKHQKVHKPKKAKKVNVAKAAKTTAEKAGPPALQVNIMRARGLRGSDVQPLGMTDPYCVCEIPGKPDAKVQTLAINGEGGVEWNHEGKITHVARGDSLRCTVYERDAVENNLLGRVVLTSRRIGTGFKGELRLSETGEDVQAYLMLAVSRTGAWGQDRDTSKKGMARKLSKAKKASVEVEDTEDDEDSEDDEDQDDDDDDDQDDDDQDDTEIEKHIPRKKILASARKHHESKGKH